MKQTRIDIWENLAYDGQDPAFRPMLDTYVLDGAKTRGAVLICPGGGYVMTSDREAEAVAIRYNAAGYHAFILWYSVAPNRHPQPLRDLSRAMAILRANAAEWKLDSDRIAVCGFSAGGHLVASLGVHWDKPYLQGIADAPEGANRPNALILCYPVISSGKHAHRGSFENLLGPGAEGVEDSELLHEMSLEFQVGEQTPPTFLWHTFDDPAVPVENSMMFAQALRKCGISVELHVYAFPKGWHGLSLVNEETRYGDTMPVDPHAGSWMELCTGWLDRLFGGRNG